MCVILYTVYTNIHSKQPEVTALMIMFSSLTQRKFISLSRSHNYILQRFDSELYLLILLINIQTKQRWKKNNLMSLIIFSFFFSENFLFLSWINRIIFQLPKQYVQRLFLKPFKIIITLIFLLSNEVFFPINLSLGIEA